MKKKCIQDFKCSHINSLYYNLVSNNQRTFWIRLNKSPLLYTPGNQSLNNIISKTYLDYVNKYPKYPIFCTNHQCLKSYLNHHIICYDTLYISKIS